MWSLASAGITAFHVREVPAILPVLPVRDVVIYPGGTVPLQVGRPPSLAALEQAGPSGFLLIATQHRPETEEPTLDDIYPMGTIARIVRLVDARENGKQALVVGVARGRIGAVVEREPALRVEVEAVPEPDLDRRVDELALRMAGVPRNQLMMQKLMINQAYENMGLASTQMVATLFDGITRHTPEGMWFKQRAEEVGFQQAVRERDSGKPIAAEVGR